jgi:hypothetical protein
MRVSDNDVLRVVELYEQGTLSANEICTILTRWILQGDSIKDLLQRLPLSVINEWRAFVSALPDSVEDHVEFRGPRYTANDQPRFDHLRERVVS